MLYMESARRLSMAVSMVDGLFCEVVTLLGSLGLHLISIAIPNIKNSR